MADYALLLKRNYQAIEQYPISIETVRDFLKFLDDNKNIKVTVDEARAIEKMRRLAEAIVELDDASL